ncbi:MAG: DEAD/DEAH box helicase [Myxococcaceae bacterium]|nr:DEAD/DEAH box helicase [Myxococcaceae bacterium]
MDAAALRRVTGETPAAAEIPPTRFHARVLAEEKSLKSGDSSTRVARALVDAKVDLNPHQVEAAVFAIESLPRGGCVLADEVGLGKTIEAGIVLAQLWAEGRKKILVLTPATLRMQWQAELSSKLDIEAVVVDGRTAGPNPFDSPNVVIASIPFAAARPELLRWIEWDLVVIDEAHRLRNAHRPGNKTGKALRTALQGRPKLLLTATPLQNEISELFGLMSLLDEQILGPSEAFESKFNGGELDEGAASELKDRLAGVVQRTLRRQVREYVRFTNRRSIVEDFQPSAEEQSLYEDVSEYLRRPDTAAIDFEKRTLLTLVYRKLLASSSHAIAPTLEKLAEGLEKKIQYLPQELAEFAEEEESWRDAGVRATRTAKELELEVKELKSYAARARALTSNAKGDALKRALDRVFTVARAHQWPDKAVVFTESRRTQDYLQKLLEPYYKVAVLSGDASTPEERAALVQDFRERAQVLLSTEAGAEGLNLQFCNLVVNYDLPWNPQRVEQRIGRCHRYGQARDVLVLNFLNRSNAADARLYELLEKKLNLFDGVFGASDEILGALESGVDFERRVLDIYQSCRAPAEIDAAFTALQSDMGKSINKRMTETRSLLLERFDGEVRKKLKLREETVKARLARSKAAAKVPLQPLEGVVKLQVTAPQLEGKTGWWFVYRFEAAGGDTLVNVVLVQDGEGWKTLPLEQGEALLKAPAIEGAVMPPSVSVAAAQEAALNQARDEVQRRHEKKAAIDIDEVRERADRFAEDCLLAPRAKVEKARDEWEAARKTRDRVQIERTERAYRKALSTLRAEEEQRYQEKDRAMAALMAKAKVTVGRTLIATACFKAV